MVVAAAFHTSTSPHLGSTTCSILRPTSVVIQGRVSAISSRAKPLASGITPARTQRNVPTFATSSSLHSGRVASSSQRGAGGGAIHQESSFVQLSAQQHLPSMSADSSTETVLSMGEGHPSPTLPPPQALVEGAASLGLHAEIV